MSGKALNRTSYWLRERNKKTADFKNCILEDLQAIENLSKQKNGFNNCSFVEKCITKAKQKTIIKNAFKNLTASKEYSCPGKFSKF